jgi:serine/threonine protein kinase
MSPINPENDSSQPRKIADRYLVVASLGAGSMGSVFHCRDTLLGGQDVAVKVLYSDLTGDTTSLARFQREVSLARSLGHPNIIRTFEYGISEGQDHFITMELLTGGSLRSRLKRGPLRTEDAARYLLDVARGLTHAHSNDVVHRDLKPDNILFSATGEVRITDFGVARGGDTSQHLTKTGDTVGTPIYMSPEIVQGGKGDKRSDLYSLGIMAYEMVNGAPPFLSGNWVTLAGMHLNSPVPPIKVAGVPSWYVMLIERLLEKSPEKRLQSAVEVVKYLESYVGRNADGSQAEGSTLFPFLGVAGASLLLGVLVGALLL